MRNKLIPLVCLFLLLTTQGCYLVKQGKGQLEIWYRQVPIEEAIEAESNERIRSLLVETREIKQFAASELYLDGGQVYNDYYSTPNEGIAFVVTACPKDKLEPYEWWFPIVGSVPYKGFFDRQDADELEEKLREGGYDTWLFVAPAYSTLGWFDDPITTPMLQGSRYTLINTIIHELTHQKVFIEGEVDFNEQLATFVGNKGAFAYLKADGGMDDDEISRIKTRRQNIDRLYSLIKDAIPALEDLYDSSLSPDRIDAERERIFQRLTDSVLDRFPKAKREDWMFNNARILQFRRYQPDAPVVENIWNDSGGDWRRFWDLINQYIAETFG